MDINPSQAANRSLSAERTESFLDSKVIANNGRLFLLYFIIGNYFGPYLKGQGPPKSLFQRAVEGLPIYTFDQLTGSRMGTVEMERIYYYVLRKTEKHLAVKLLPLQQFFLGNLLTPGTNRYPQFTDMFPAHLHPHSVMENGDKFVSSIIFINNPDTSHFDLKDIERFKRLAGLENLFLDRDEATLIRAYVDGALYDAILHEAGHGIEFPHTSNRFSRERAEPADRIPQSRHQHVQGSGSSTSRQATTRRLAEDGPALLFLPSRADKEELSALMAATKTGLALTGNAAMGQVEQVDGPVDIGECEDAYYFRVSLPGVRNDPSVFHSKLNTCSHLTPICLVLNYCSLTADEFSYKIEADGKVVVKGVTITGDRENCVQVLANYPKIFAHQASFPSHFNCLVQLILASLQAILAMMGF